MSQHHYRSRIAIALSTVIVTLAATNAHAVSTIPARSFTSDLLYQVLVAEIALQRDQPLTAFSYYFAAADRATNPELAELATQAALAADAPAQAELAVNYWLYLTPESLAAHQTAAHVALSANHLETALTHLRAMVSLAKIPAQGYVQVARLLTQLPDPKQRLALLDTLIANKTDDADAQLTLAALAAGAGDTAQARNYAERAAQLRPAWSNPQHFLAQLFMEDKQYGAARALLERYFAQGYDDVELRLLYAQLLIENDDTAAARRALDTVLTQRPNLPNVLLAAAMLSLQAKEYSAAREYLLRLKTTDTKTDEALFLLGQVEEAAEQFTAAINWYEQVRGDKAYDAQLRTAAVYAKMNAMPRAQDILQQLRQQWPDKAVQLYLAEGELLQEYKQREAALAVYSNAIQQNQNHLDLLYARALLAASMGRVEILERDLHRVLALNPDHINALNALGYTLVDQTNRIAEGRQFIERALKLAPKEPAILDSMGWVLYRSGQPAQAEPYLRQALDLFNDGEIAAHLGEVLWQLNRRDEARVIWERARNNDPEHEYLLRTIHRYLPNTKTGS